MNVRTDINIYERHFRDSGTITTFLLLGECVSLYNDWDRTVGLLVFNCYIPVGLREKMCR